MLTRVTIFASALVTALQVTTLASLAAQWTSQRDAGLGFAYSYPPDLFQEIEGDGKPSFHYFETPNSDAKFLVGGWNNRASRSPESFKQWLIANAGGYDEVTYHPRGRSWFVLSGYRGDQIYYEKVMFSCRARHRERDCDYVPGGGAQTIRPHRRANGRSFPARPVLEVVGLIEARHARFKKHTTAISRIHNHGSAGLG